MTDFFPAGRTRYPGRNAEEKTISQISDLRYSIHNLSEDVK